jgi:hypothetical protein
MNADEISYQCEILYWLIEFYAFIIKISLKQLNVFYFIACSTKKFRNLTEKYAVIQIQ